jgi:hypothetical protein
MRGLFTVCVLLLLCVIPVFAVVADAATADNGGTPSIVITMPDQPTMVCPLAPADACSSCAGCDKTITRVRVAVATTAPRRLLSATAKVVKAKPARRIVVAAVARVHSRPALHRLRACRSCR